MPPDLYRIIVIVAVALIACWFVIERFSPDTLITKIVKIIIFVAVLVAIVLAFWS